MYRDEPASVARTAPPDATRPAKLEQFLLHFPLWTRGRLGHQFVDQAQPAVAFGVVELLLLRTVDRDGFAEHLALRPFLPFGNRPDQIDCRVIEGEGHLLGHIAILPYHYTAIPLMPVHDDRSTHVHLM